jgi:DNA polymerase II small subunit/DNA polymerase delta subunit B
MARTHANLEPTYGGRLRLYAEALSTIWIVQRWPWATLTGHHEKSEASNINLF